MKFQPFLLGSGDNFQRWTVSFRESTPRKIKIESENDGLEDDSFPFGAFRSVFLERLLLVSVRVNGYEIGHFLQIEAEQKKDTLPKFNIAPEKWWLEDYFPFGLVYFQGLC